METNQQEKKDRNSYLIKKKKKSHQESTLPIDLQIVKIFNQIIELTVLPTTTVGHNSHGLAVWMMFPQCFSSFIQQEVPVIQLLTL